MKDLKFDFNDINIVPRTNVHINSRYTDINLPLNLPLFTAPMDTVVNLDNAEIFLNNNINVCLPRTIGFDKFKEFYDNKPKRKNSPFINKLNPFYKNLFIAVGFADLDLYYKDNFRIFYENTHLLIDIANGHMQKIVDYCKEIKRLRPDIVIMVGNIANPETYYWYAKNDCVDYIRVGIGNGNGCLTTKQSGVGYPMASLIQEVYQKKQEFFIDNDIDKKFENSILKTKPVKTIPAIVADGGMKDYSDVIKALALGADYVMIGSIFNKALESSAQNYIHGIKIGKCYAKLLFDNGLPVKKYYRGMSTKAAQLAMGKTNLRTSEGITRFRPVEYHLNTWVDNFKHYLRNAMSYVDAKTLEDFIGKTEIICITKNAYDRFNK